MRWGKKLVVLAVISLLAAFPVVANAGYEGKRVPVTVRVIHPMKSFEMTTEISELDAKEISEKIGEAQQALEIICDDSSSDDEKNTAREVLEAFINHLVELGILPASFVTNFLVNFLSPKMDFILPIISFGRGFSFIPLYPGEAFIGFMFRPIIVQYFLLGYTASLNVNLLPPRIEYWDMVGTHTLIILGFVGIYIDLGKIGYGIPKVQFIMGEALLAGGLDWF